jgi:DNA-directed RNA polymerase specialized sigma subunit
VLSSPREVVRCLITYTDWWQPSTTSILQVGSARRDSGTPDGFRSDLLDHLDERTELCRRMALLAERERKLLYLWYMRDLPTREIARGVGVSRRHLFRLRAEAIRKLADPGDIDRVA